MKIIINSKSLHDAILKALNYKNIQIKVTEKCLCFGKIRVELDFLSDELDFKVEKLDFDMPKWIEILTLLYKIETQPIILEIIEDVIFIQCIIKF